MAIVTPEKLDGFLVPADFRAAPVEVPAGGPLTELRGLQTVSERIARATDLEGLLGCTLTTLDELLGFSHSMLLVHEESCGRLVTIASRGYGAQGIGAEVRLGEGLIGTVAEKRRMLRVTGVGQDLLYGRADAGVEHVVIEENLAVGDGDHVGRHERGHVAGLGLDDRQRRQ